MQALEQTKEAIQLIRTRMEPLLRRYPADPTTMAAIALCLGTLRFMGSRLRGIKPSDPLRQQLNQIRVLLRRAQKFQADRNPQPSSTPANCHANATTDTSLGNAMVEETNEVSPEMKRPESPSEHPFSSSHNAQAAPAVPTDDEPMESRNMIIVEPLHNREGISKHHGERLGRPTASTSSTSQSKKRRSSSKKRRR